MDDTTVPLLARGGTKTARLWTYVRDDRPFAGGAPPAALFYFSRDREMAHPNRHLAGWRGIHQDSRCTVHLHPEVTTETGVTGDVVHFSPRICAQFAQPGTGFFKTRIFHGGHFCNG